ncbi:MAG: translation elongation factor Ts [Deltaproteobacteria bacterium]|nr:translation elongation factor Ts [Deltaproteobacteria bacterium]MBW1874399.1 translation elongation factor Ts [Deltaproteobacteria bacterium]MBW2210595.1 translation elongation factor Ts [Deltaproteobacteria bacterium]MBW2213342.1 translation elongation factor Ts [Deltaproteobacteria bacterium]MBW2378703.1 translation elongation factor Ts [Deltaproteobacteria bacterium]
MSDVSASMVKSLRDRTGAGMMACRDALRETSGDEEKAIEVIQKKGLSKVAKKAGAIAGDGLVHAYIHGAGRVGVLLEVNCQTDFVARGDDFQQFVEETAMQVAAESPLFVSEDDIPDNEILARTAVFRGQLDEEAKATGKERPAAAIEKIIEGKLAKWKRESCLLDQVSIMHDDKTIRQLLEALTVKLGEKIKVRRFSRYELGEGIEKKKTDLAAEVTEALKGS